MISCQTFFSLLPMADVLAKFELFKCFSQWFQFVWLLKKMCSGVCDSTCSSIFSIPQKHEYPLSSVNYSAWLCMFAAHVFSNWWRHLLYLLLEFGLFVCLFFLKLLCIELSWSPHRGQNISLLSASLRDDSTIELRVMCHVDLAGNI